jgi:hypothetical protein
MKAFILALGLIVAIPLAFANDTSNPNSGGNQRTPGSPIVEQEIHNGQVWQRVRYLGDDAVRMCAEIGIQIMNEKPGFIENNETFSCLMSANGPIFGYLVGPKGQRANLEAFGYD